MTQQEPVGAGSIPPHQQPISTIPPASEGNAEPPQSMNVLALISFIVAVVGFIFACLPGALIIGWILLPIAFILAIVSLFLRGRGKGFGIAGLIVSVVGTIVGFIVFFAVVTTSFSQTFDDGPVVIGGPTAGTDSGGSSVNGGTSAGASSGTQSQEGTRDNPVPLGTAISSDQWTVVIDSYNANANDVVASANQFNQAPEPGTHYEIVTYTVTYTGADSAYAAEVGVDVVTDSGNVIESYSTLVILDNNFSMDELYAGASSTGSKAFLVPDGSSVLIRVQPGFFAKDVFVAP